MRRVKLKSFAIEVKISLTADDWKLDNTPGRDEAAREINRDLQWTLEDCTGDWYCRAQACVAVEGFTPETLVVFDRVLKSIGLKDPL